MWKCCLCWACVAIMSAAAMADIVSKEPLESSEKTLLLFPMDGRTVEEALRGTSSTGKAFRLRRGKVDIVTGRFGGAVTLSETTELQCQMPDATIPAEGFRFACWLRVDKKQAEGGAPIAIGVRLDDGKNRGSIQWSVQRWAHESDLFRDWQIGLQVLPLPPARRRQTFYSIEQWRDDDWHHVGVSYEPGAAPGSGVSRLFVDGVCVGIMPGIGAMPAKGMTFFLTAAKSGAAVDDVALLRGAEPFTTPTVEWEGFLPGPGQNRCHPDQLIYLYFSQPMDRRFAGIQLVDETENRPVVREGAFVGDGSVYKIAVSAQKPLPLGHRYCLRFPDRPETQLRSVDGAPFDPSRIGPQWFETRAKNEPPHRLAILLRNDNLTATLEGTEQALRNGLSIVEINPVRLKDAWVSNHTWDRGREMPRTLYPGEGGDTKGFLAVPTAPRDTPYATYAALDYVNLKDGKIDPLPHFEDQVRIINRWDKLIALQGYGPGTVEEYRALYQRCGWRWDRVIVFHGDPNACYAKPEITWQHWRAFPRARNWLIGNGYQVRGSLIDSDPLFPNGITPAFMAAAKKLGKTTWTYASVSANMALATRLGIDVAPPDNGLAFKSDLRARQELYRLNDWEGARPPCVVGVSCGQAPLDGRQDVELQPTWILDFDLPMEACSVNYDTVRLLPEGAKDSERIPLYIRTEGDAAGFTLKPQLPLASGQRYTLTIGFGQEPKAASGHTLSRPFTARFATQK